MTQFKGPSSSQTFLSTADLARLLEISPQRVHQLIRNGRIPAPTVRVGRSVGYTPDAAAQIMAARRSQGPGDPWVGPSSKPSDSSME